MRLTRPLSERERGRSIAKTVVSTLNTVSTRRRTGAGQGGDGNDYPVLAEHR